MTPKRWLVFILCLTFIAAVIGMPKEVPIKIHWQKINFETVLRRPVIDTVIGGKRVYKDFEIKQGLDLQGGTHVVLKAEMGQVALEDRENALESAKQIIQRRIDLYGIGEPLIQTSVVNEDYRIIVELPGVKDINEALTLIGQTAQLDFRELAPGATEAATLEDFVITELTGKNLRKSEVKFGQTGGSEVGLLFDEAGTKLFSSITERNVNKPLGIFIDGYPVTIPNVSTHITSGEAVITGSYTLEEAKNLSIQLNAGALPVPIEIIEQRNVGASLGQDSVEKGLRAGLVGLEMVMLFMILYYGWSGLIADVALIIYGLLTLAIYKLIPVTVTLPGLAGFILSVGMAVDSNILIFERMKEELKMGKPVRTAMELGFGRAWDSIKDANVATLTTAFILFNPLNWNFLNTSGMIRGFALTLTLGILISLFTGIVVTRTLMRLFYHTSPAKGKIK
jgi:preprotein translocase subunit SecD